MCSEVRTLLRITLNYSICSYLSFTDEELWQHSNKLDNESSDAQSLCNGRYQQCHEFDSDQSTNNNNTPRPVEKYHFKSSVTGTFIMY